MGAIASIVHRHICSTSTLIKKSSRTQHSHLHLLLPLLCLLVLQTANAAAQITNVANDTITPIEGVGHDYIKMMSETVNPANGGLNIHIDMPVAKSRGLTVPFSITYDSNNVHHLNPGTYPNYGTSVWEANSSLLGQGGWAFALPYARVSAWTDNVAVFTGNSGSEPLYTGYTCWNATNYVMLDLSLVSHALGVGLRTGGGGDPNNYCKAVSVATGSDDKVYSSLGAWGGGNVPALVTDDDQGNVYKFSAFRADNANDLTSSAALPDSIEDRNGNIARFAVNSSNAVTVTDSSGRISISTNGFGPSVSPNNIIVSGETFQVAWRTISAGFATQSNWAGFPNDPDPTYDNCSPPPVASDSPTVVSQITLPNGKSYKFYYGKDITPHNAQTNPYALLSEIDYPSGVWVTYSWKLNNTYNDFRDYNELAIYPGVYLASPCSCSNCYAVTGVTCPAPVANGCRYQYKTPVVASRQVSFGGSSPALTQTFVYSTTWSSSLPLAGWSSKTTTVTTTDNVTGKSASTTYTYGSIPAPPPPSLSIGPSPIPAQIAVENTVNYNDWNSNLLLTSTKDWLDQFDIKLDQKTTYPSGISSKKTYTYLTTSSNIIEPQEVDEFDFSATSPTRKTVTTYQSFSNAPGQLVSEPCKVVTSDGNGNAVSETDYLYDNGGTVCAPESSLSQPYPKSVTPLVPSGTHDSAFEGSTIPRGNLTKIVRWLNGGTSPTTSYAYDETGHVISATDACGNATCGDMTGTSHTTTYSYNDAYTILSGGQNTNYTPTNGATNALPTKIIDPLGHIATFRYDYYSSQLTSSTDPNNQVTGYIYNDVFARPTQVNTPDGGQTTLVYNDAAYSPSANTPSVTTTKKITSSLNQVNIAATDGLGHVVRTILNSDPDGVDTTDTTYDGFGRVLTQSNPHRSGASSSDGTAIYNYDALGRTISVQKQDGSAVQTTYDQLGTNPSTNTPEICTTVTDEVGNPRKSCTDGLGRLVEVDEPGTGANVGTAGTGTITLGGSEQSTTVTYTYPCGYNGTQTCTGSTTVYDSGTVYVTVNGITSSATYGPGVTTSSLANSIASQLNTTGFVTASVNGSVITVTADSVGTSGDYSISTSTTWNTQYFSQPSFSANASASLTGGTNSTLGTPLVTLYNYNLLGDLLCTWQKGADTTAATFSYNASTNTSNCLTAASTAWRPRSFTYDTLSRLTGATNPESGTISYQYDANGNVQAKTAPKPNKIPADTSSPQTVTTNFTYDNLNRLLQKSYTDGTTTVQYAYDGNAIVSACPVSNPPALSTTNPIGHRTAMCDASGATSWGYDITSGTGWATTEKRTLNGITKTTITQNNLGGMLYQLTYPSGRMVTYQPTTAGRYASAIDSGTGITYAQSATYAAFGGLAGLKNSSTAITITNTYNNRLQPLTISASSGSGSILSLNYTFRSGTSPYGNNGNVLSIANGRDPSRNQTFTYDMLNRITSGMNQDTSHGWCWGYNYAVDSWGNRTNETGSTQRPNCPAYSNLTPADTAGKNRISGACYDLAGNYLGANPCPSTPPYNQQIYTYDAENRIVSLSGSGVTYTYDGDGNRVKKSNGTLYWGESTGSTLAESDLSGNTQREYITFNGKRIARLDLTLNCTTVGPSCAHYYFSDHLGSSNVVTDYLGTMAPCPAANSPVGYTTPNTSVATGEEESDFQPYGREVVLCDRVPQHYKFTGKERDAESGNDNFAARYYGSNMGRFMSPDEPLLDQEESNPQSWNLYSYVRNNPLNSVDPDGNAHSECKDENGQEVCYIVGDKNGELINNGTLQWNAKKQEWEKPEEHTYNDEDRIEFIANRVSDLTSFHSIWEVGTNALPFAMGGYAAARITMAAPGLITLGLSNPSEETLVIGKVADLQQLRPGERTLDLPNQGSPKANWIQNSSRLRQAMNEGKPIRDASAGNPGSNTGFLRAERNLLQSHGWTLKGEYWVPPGK